MLHPLYSVGRSSLPVLALLGAASWVGFAWQDLGSVGAIGVLVGCAGLLSAAWVQARANRRARALGSCVAELERSLERARQGDFSAAVIVAPTHPLARLCASYDIVLSRWRDTLATPPPPRQEPAREETSGLLHNVANALTSVSAGVDLAVQQVQALPIHGLAEVVKRCEDSTDPAFDHLRPALAEVRRALEEQRDELRCDLDLVLTASSHAIELIRAQQPATRHKTSPLRIEAVLDDAIRMAHLVRQDHAIAIVRRIEDDVQTNVDRHRLLEILVNLLNNAVDALRTVKRPDKRIEVLLRRRRDAFEIRVSDNGPGIPRELEPRIFDYGFSTKPDGHGFGLHSSWCTARALGGQLQLERCTEGAAFSLVLPLPCRDAAGAETPLAAEVASVGTPLAAEVA